MMIVGGVKDKPCNEELCIVTSTQVTGVTLNNIKWFPTPTVEMERRDAMK